MSGDTDAVHEAIGRWEAAELIDGRTARQLRAEVAASATEGTRRLSQYVLAVTGAVVLVLAGGVFLDWAWPQLGDAGRSSVLALAGVGVLAVGVAFENADRWRPASYLMQTAGMALVLSAYVYSERAWGDATLGGTVIGLLALITPIVLAPRAMRRSEVMPAVHLAMGLAFLAVFLDRSTPLSADATVWVLDAVLLSAMGVLVQVIREDPDGARHPWALNAFVTAMCAGFVLVTITCIEALDLSDETLLPLDLWLGLCAVLTLWGIHRAPEGLRRGWFGRLLAYEMLGWIVLGSATVSETFDAPPELAVLLVGGVGVAAFVHADRHGLRLLMGAASLGFIAPVWWWSVDRAGALGGVAALLATAGFLFWASGRRGRSGAESG